MTGRSRNYRVYKHDKQMGFRKQEQEKKIKNGFPERERERNEEVKRYELYKKK